MDFGKVLKVSEVAAILRVHPATVRRMIGDGPGQLRAIRIGQGTGAEVRITERALREYMGLPLEAADDETARG